MKQININAIWWLRFAWVVFYIHVYAVNSALLDMCNMGELRLLWEPSFFKFPGFYAGKVNPKLACINIM